MITVNCQERNLKIRPVGRIVKSWTGYVGMISQSNLRIQESGPLRCLKKIKINNSLHLARKYARMFVRGHYLFRVANSFPRAQLEENCELQGTDYVQGQISEHIFAPNGGYCLYYPSNLLRNARSFENWGISSDIPQFQLGNIRPRDAFRPIARERKYLMDYKD